MAEKILVLINNIGGLYNFRKEVVKAIVDEGYDVYISEPDDDERVKYFERIGCKVIRTQFKRRGMNPLADLKLLMTYLKMIKHLKPKAVLSYTIKPNVYGGMACKICGVSQLANVTGLGDAVENGGWLQKLTVSLYRIGLGKARRVFFQNQANRKFCIEHGIADSSSILLPGSGVNLQYHAFQEYAPDGVTKFLFIARLLKDKGIGEYFEMAKTIKKNHPNTEFLILGFAEGDYQERLDKLVADGVVNYLGTTSDVRPYLAQVHCTVLPSYHEGMSNVNLESAANGRAVITTNIPGCRETVDDGRTGYLVEPRNVNSLIEAVERFIHMPYEQKVQMGERARKKVEQEFDRQIVVETYINELRSLSNV